MARHSSESRRNLIVQTAFECFSQFGYSKTSLDLIAQHANISRPLIYQHFKDKEDLFASMLEEHLEERYQLANECLSSSLPKKEKLYAMVEIIMMKELSLISNSINNSFNKIEIFSDLLRVLPKFETKYRKKFIDMATTILEDHELAEVFRFSLGGLKADNPSTPVLRKRVKLLIDCICP